MLCTLSVLTYYKCTSAIWKSHVLLTVPAGRQARGRGSWHMWRCACCELPVACIYRHTCFQCTTASGSEPVETRSCSGPSEVKMWWSMCCRGWENKRNRQYVPDRIDHVPDRIDCTYFKNVLWPQVLNEPLTHCCSQIAIKLFRNGTLIQYSIVWWMNEWMNEWVNQSINQSR